MLHCGFQLVSFIDLMSCRSKNRKSRGFFSSYFSFKDLIRATLLHSALHRMFLQKSEISYLNKTLSILSFHLISYIISRYIYIT